MTAGKTVGLRERQIKERFRPRTFESQLQRYIQQRGAAHRDREEFRLASPLFHRKLNDDDDRPNSQRDRSANDRKSTHDDCERWRSKLVDRRARDFVKASRIVFKDLVRQPPKEN